MAFNKTSGSQDAFNKTLNPRNIFIDIDHTICFYEDNKTLNYKLALPNYRRIDIVNNLYDQGHHITMWTARGMKTGIDWTDITKHQLRSWKVKYHELRLDKPPFDLLIDDKAITCVEQLSLIKNLIG